MVLVCFGHCLMPPMSCVLMSQTCPVNVADRVNLGLIPSSEAGWPSGCAALRSESGGVLHIHATVRSKSTADCDDCKQSLRGHFEKNSADVAESETTPRSSCAGVDGGLDANIDNCYNTASCDDITADVTKSRYAKTCGTKRAWSDWAVRACETVRGHLTDLLRCDWSVSLLHIEHVKSYAPHVDHIVADIQCRPPS